MTLHVTVSKFLKILQNDLPSKILKCTLCSIVQTTRKQRQLPATRCKSKHYSTSSQHQGVAHWPVLVYNAIVLAEVSATREPQWDSSAHFLLTFSYPVSTNDILPYGEQVRQRDCYSTRKHWLGNGTWGESRYCIPESEKMGMEEMWCHLSNPLPNRADLKGAADCKKRNKPSCAESHEHNIAHTNDFISPSAKHLSPKSCTHTGQIMEQCYRHTIKILLL